MKLRIYREYGALNSKPIFDAVETGLKKIGHTVVTTGEDIPIIWSVLWSGRMAPNKTIFETCRKNRIPIMIVEVGNLFRGKTWRISLNHINNEGFFENHSNLDLDRPKKLGVSLKNFQENRNPSILIATQHDRSLQWEGQPSMATWTSEQISKIRQYTDRPIVVRPHPRCRFSLNIAGVRLEVPKMIPGTYDDFDINYNYHCVINHNSGPAVQAAIHGVPIICNNSSLAYPVSDKLENIEKIVLPDREQWLLDLTHTEWTVDEIADGIPFRRILEKI